jgi:hypothetical protein
MNRRIVEIIIVANWIRSWTSYERLELGLKHRFPTVRHDKWAISRIDGRSNYP